MRHYLAFLNVPLRYQYEKVKYLLKNTNIVGVCAGIAVMLYEIKWTTEVRPRESLYTVS